MHLLQVCLEFKICCRFLLWHLALRARGFSFCYVAASQHGLAEVVEAVYGIGCVGGFGLGSKLSCAGLRLVFLGVVAVLVISGSWVWRAYRLSFRESW